MNFLHLLQVSNSIYKQNALLSFCQILIDCMPITKLISLKKSAVIDSGFYWAFKNSCSVNTFSCRAYFCTSNF